MGVTYSNKARNLTSQSVIPFTQRLDLLGDGTGTTNANGNYVVPTRFRLIPAAGELIVVHELHIYVEDGGSLDSGTYGNGLVLVNGIRAELKQGPTTVGLTNNNVMNNSHWTRVTFNTQTLTFGGGNEAIAWRWDIANMHVPLALTDNDELALILQDNFTGLVSHSFSVRGYKFIS